MCGIVNVVSFDGSPVNKLVASQFQAQRNRGVQGFGLFDYDFKNLVRSTTEHKILKWLDRYPSSNILFHHRLPTSTDNVYNACHPFSSKDHFKTNYVLVHNGWISNASAMKIKHESLGIKYYSVQPDGSFNDSEALLWEVALYLEGKQDEVEARGRIAFICLAVGKGNKHPKLYFGRNTNPLNMHLDDKHLSLSSEGKGEPIRDNTLYSFNLKTLALDTKDLDLKEYVWSGGSGNTSLERQWAYNDYEDDWQTQLNGSSKSYKIVTFNDIKDFMWHSFKLEGVFSAQVAKTVERYLKTASGDYELAMDNLELDIDDLLGFDEDRLDSWVSNYGNFTKADYDHSVQVMFSAYDILESGWFGGDDTTTAPQLPIAELTGKES